MIKTSYNVLVLDLRVDTAYIRPLIVYYFYLFTNSAPYFLYNCLPLQPDSDAGLEPPAAIKSEKKKKPTTKAKQKPGNSI